MEPVPHMNEENELNIAIDKLERELSAHSAIKFNIEENLKVKHARLEFLKRHKSLFEKGG